MAPFLAHDLTHSQTKVFLIFILFFVSRFPHSFNKSGSLRDENFSKIVLRSRRHSASSKSSSSCKNLRKGWVRILNASVLSITISKLKNGRTISKNTSRLSPSLNHTLMCSRASCRLLFSPPLKILHADLIFLISRVRKFPTAFKISVLKFLWWANFP